MDSEKTVVYNTPLLVNTLRFIRNRRLPPGDAYGSGETPFQTFEFAGLCIKDCGPFKEAEDVWAGQSLLEGGDVLRHERGSTFTGPLHMLVIVDGVTVEHWKVEDYREEHTENSFARSHEHVVKLNDLARILYTYLCCGDVYSAIERTANELLARSFAPAEGRGSGTRRDDVTEGEESPLSSSNQHFSAAGSGCDTPVTTAGNSTPTIAIRPPASSRGTSVPGSRQLRFNGTELLVIGAEGRECDALLRERGLLHKVNRESSAAFAFLHATGSRFDQRHWYVEELLSVSVIRDTVWEATTSTSDDDATKNGEAPAPAATGAPAARGEARPPPSRIAEDGQSSRELRQGQQEDPATQPPSQPSTTVRTVPAVASEHADPASDGAREPLKPRPVEPPAHTTPTATAPSSPTSSDDDQEGEGVTAMEPSAANDGEGGDAASALSGEDPAAPFRRQGLPLARRNPAPCPSSVMNSPSLGPAGAGSQPSSQPRRQLNAPPAWAGDLTRHSAVLASVSQSGTFARLRASEERDEAGVAVSALDLYTACLRLSRAGDTQQFSLTDLLLPLRP